MRKLKFGVIQSGQSFTHRAIW